MIPFRISGPLASPSIQIDFAALVKERAEEEIRERVIDSLLGGDDEEAEDEEKSTEDELKDALKDLLRR